MQDLPEKRKQAPYQWWHRMLLTILMLLVIPSGLFCYRLSHPPIAVDFITSMSFRQAISTMYGGTKDTPKDLYCLAVSMYDFAHPEINANALDDEFRKNLQIMLDNQFVTEEAINTTTFLMLMKTMKNGQEVSYGGPVEVCVDITALPDGLHIITVGSSNGIDAPLTQTWQFTKTRPLLPDLGE